MSSTRPARARGVCQSLASVRFRDHRTRLLRNRGQALVEFVFGLPIMLLILVIAIDFGRLFFTYVAVNNAVREAANFAALHASDTPFVGAEYTAGVAAAAMGETNAQAQGGAGAMTVSAPTCFRATNPPTNPPTTIVSCATAANFAAGFGNQVSVAVTQTFTFLTPIVSSFFGAGLTVGSSATAPVLNPLVARITSLPTPAPTPAPTPTPTPTPQPTPTPTLPPGATPAPTPTPTVAPTPTPIPYCTVPNFWHTFWADIGSVQVWQDAGFTGTPTDNTNGHKI